VIFTTRNIKVYVYGRAADMRWGFDGLYARVVEAFGRPPLSGDVFLFIGKDLRRAKALMWDGTGLMMVSKRLEKNRFPALFRDKTRRAELTLSELALFFEGSKEVGRAALSPEEYKPNFVA
jgi:transposase